MISLPDKIFFTGVPGSRWSGIAQTLEQISGFNLTDRKPNRKYQHSQYSGHVGSYFGHGMEFEPWLDQQYIDSAWKTAGGCKIVKSHDWAYCLDEIKTKFANDWIMLVYRPDMASYAWWHQAGGFNIKYPNYSYYENSSKMLGKITEQNSMILSFACKHNLIWSYFTPDWVELNFGKRIEIKNTWNDVLVSLIK